MRCWSHGISSALLYTSSFICNFYTFLTFSLTQWYVLTAFHYLGARPPPPGPHPVNSAPSFLSPLSPSLPPVNHLTLLRPRLHSHPLRCMFLRRPASSPYFTLHHLSPLAKWHLLLFRWHCSFKSARTAFLVPKDLLLKISTTFDVLIRSSTSSMVNKFVLNGWIKELCFSPLVSMTWSHLFSFAVSWPLLFSLFFPAFSFFC